MPSNRVTGVPASSVTRSQKVNMPAAHRTPWMQSPVGVMYLANGWKLSATHSGGKAEAAFVVVTMYQASMYVK